MENKKPKVIVYHPMQQHSYKTAQALIKENILFEYWTAIYYNPKKLLYRVLEKVIGKSNVEHMKNRVSEELTPYVRTCGTLRGLMFLFAQRKIKSQKTYYKFQDKLVKKTGKIVAKKAIKNDVDVIIAYDTWAYALIKELKKRKSKIKVVIDYSSLYAEEILDIVKKDIQNANGQERGYASLFEKFNKKYLDYYRYEKDNAHYFLSASSVTDQSLTNYRVEKDKIFRCTYGTYFNPVPVENKSSEIVNFIYIGRLSYAKGVHYLIEAFENLDRDDFVLTLVGKDVDQMQERTNNPKIQFAGLVNHDKIPKLLEQADVIISASLYDGFSLALLEGASYNLPIICTDNMGVADYVVENLNGSVVKAQDVQALRKVVNDWLDDKPKITKMSKNVGDIVKKLTWDNYNKQVVSVVEKIFLTEREN